MIQKKGNFGKNVGLQAQQKKKESSTFGYLIMPKGIEKFSPEPDTRYDLDFIPYIVSDKHHPDHNDELETALVGDLWWRRSFKTHRNIGPKNITIVCPTTFGQKCPVCEYQAKRIREGADTKETNALKTSDRDLYVVIPLNSKKHEKKLHIWDMAQALFYKLLENDLAERPERGIFPSLENGKTLSIRFEAKTVPGSKPFANANRIDFEDRAKQYSQDILETVPDLDKIFKVMSYEEIAKLFFEMDEPVEEDTETHDDSSIRNEPETESAPVSEMKSRERAFEEEGKEKRRRKDPEPDPEPTGPTWTDLLALTGRKLTKFCDENKLKLDPDKYEEDEELRTAIAEELNIPTPNQVKKESSARKNEESAPAQEKESKTNAGGSSKDRCPHGHIFGKDTSKFKECDNCAIWDDCDEANK